MLCHRLSMMTHTRLLFIRSNRLSTTTHTRLLLIRSNSLSTTTHTSLLLISSNSLSTTTHSRLLLIRNQYMFYLTCKEDAILYMRDNYLFPDLKFNLSCFVSYKARISSISSTGYYMAQTPKLLNASRVADRGGLWVVGHAVRLL